MDFEISNQHADDLDFYRVPVFAEITSQQFIIFFQVGCVRVFSTSKQPGF